MKIIKHSEIRSLGLSPLQYMKWVEEALLNQQRSTLPPKTSIALPNDGFFNIMPCYIPESNVMGVKVVNRFLCNNPALDASLLLYNATTGEQKALMDATLITTMRTGAVAATSILKLMKKKSETNILSIMGLGATARATLLCLLDATPEKTFIIRLMKYKDQAEKFVERFKAYENISFQIVDEYEKFFVGADIIVSCITSATQTYGKDDWFKKGVLVVPVHTRGFQNCDLFFDKVYGDLKDQISHFKFFNEFKYFNEFTKVVQGEDKGRENDSERILVYNIGIALHDIYIAEKIFTLIMEKAEIVADFDFKEDVDKFYL